MDSNIWAIKSYLTHFFYVCNKNLSGWVTYVYMFSHHYEACILQNTDKYKICRHLHTNVHIHDN